MKAAITQKQGPPEVLKIRELAKPTPGEHDLLIKVQAATVTPGDVMLRKTHPLLLILLRIFGVKPKKIPGHEFSGVIEATGDGVEKFQVGDHVFGTTTGLRTGASAEYICLSEKMKTGSLAIKPENLSFPEAAALPVGGMTALFLLKKAGIEPGSTVLIYGASGSVGTYAVQLAAKHYGAAVTGVCSTSSKVLVKSLGAVQVLDYTREDLTQIEMKFDVVFDAVGKLHPDQKTNLLKEGGAFITVQTPTRENEENLKIISQLAREGKLKPVIDRSFPLGEIAAAHRYVETGRKKGNLVINIAN